MLGLGLCKQFISWQLAFYQVPQIRVLENKWRDRGEESVFASFCFLAFLGGEAPVWTFSSALHFSQFFRLFQHFPKQPILLSQTCPNQLNDVSSSDLWFQDLWDCFNKLLGSDRLRFFSLFLQLSKWELLSCMMIQCFILSAFNICLTTLYMFFLLKHLVWFVGSWLNPDW